MWLNKVGVVHFLPVCPSVCSSVYLFECDNFFYQPTKRANRNNGYWHLDMILLIHVWNIHLQLQCRRDAYGIRTRNWLSFASTFSVLFVIVLCLVSNIVSFWWYLHVIPIKYADISFIIYITHKETHSLDIGQMIYK